MEHGAPGNPDTTKEKLEQEGKLQTCMLCRVFFLPQWLWHWNHVQGMLMRTSRYLREAAPYALFGSDCGERSRRKQPGGSPPLLQGSCKIGGSFQWTASATSAKTMHLQGLKGHRRFRCPGPRCQLPGLAHRTYVLPLPGRTPEHGPCSSSFNLRKLSQQGARHVQVASSRAHLDHHHQPQRPNST